MVDRSSPNHERIDPHAWQALSVEDGNTDSIVFSHRAQNPGVSRQVALCQDRDRAAWARIGDPQANLLADGYGSTNPRILHEVGPVDARFYDDVGAKPASFKAPLRIELPETRHGCGRQYVEGGVSEDLPFIMKAPMSMIVVGSKGSMRSTLGDSGRVAVKVTDRPS